MIDQTVKLFPADKNYILKEAQAFLKDSLLEETAYKIVEVYISRHNALGLIDSFINKLKTYKYTANPVLEVMYQDMAAYYRYLHADNQLEFLFDGRSQLNKFSGEWRKTFSKWMDEICQNPHFLKALLGATVLYPGSKGEELLESNIRNNLSRHFNLKIYKYKGICEINAA